MASRGSSRADRDAGVDLRQELHECVDEERVIVDD